MNKNDDIEKFPKKLHLKLKKPEYNLLNSDKEFSTPSMCTIKNKKIFKSLTNKI